MSSGWLIGSLVRISYELRRGALKDALRIIGFFIGVVWIASCASEGSGDRSAVPTGPIGALFADENIDAALDEYAVLVEEEIARCMAAQGFEFRVSGADEPDIARSADELSESEWTARYGYGISTAFSSFDFRDDSDPNIEVLVGLTDAEVLQWHEALSAGSPEVGPGGRDTRPLTEQGCVGEAVIATGGAPLLDGLLAFGDAYENGRAELFAQPEMVDATSAWSRCMSAEGFPDFSSLDEPEREVRSRVEALYRETISSLPRLSREDFQAWFNGESREAEPDFGREGLVDLQSYEISLARADAECYRAEVEAVYAPLQAWLETDLLAEFGDALQPLESIAD